LQKYVGKCLLSFQATPNSYVQDKDVPKEEDKKEGGQTVSDMHALGLTGGPSDGVFGNILRAYLELIV